MSITLTNEQNTLLQTRIKGSGEGSPIVGDYIVVIEDSVVHVRDEDLYKMRDEKQFIRGTEYVLLQITKITKNSIWTVPSFNFRHKEYYRFVKVEGTWSLAYPLNCERNNYIASSWILSSDAHEIFNSVKPLYIGYSRDLSTCIHCQRLTKTFYQGKYYYAGVCPECYGNGIRETCNCHNCSELD